MTEYSKNESWQDKDFVNWYNEVSNVATCEVNQFIELLDLTSSDNLLDLGCGDGSFLKLMAPLVESAMGVDTSSHQIHTAREKLSEFKNITLITTEFGELDLANSYFSKGFARLSLHHLKDEDKTNLFKRIGPSFIAGALFLIDDVILDFNKEEFKANETRFLDDVRKYYGKDFEEKKDMLMDTIFNEDVTDYNKMFAALNGGGFQCIQILKDNCFSGKILAKKESKSYE